MRKIRLFCVYAFVLASVPAVCPGQVDTRWKIHDRSRPVPPVIEPGTASTQEAPGRAPSDAVALFDGKDLSQWTQKKDGSPAKWKVENGYFEVVPQTGDIQTRSSRSRLSIRSEEHTSELQSLRHLVCRLLLEKKKKKNNKNKQRIVIRT